jgi:broad specificity phosphatase PhoE
MTVARATRAQAAVEVQVPVDGTPHVDAQPIVSIPEPKTEASDRVRVSSKLAFSDPIDAAIARLRGDARPIDFGALAGEIASLDRGSLQRLFKELRKELDLPAMPRDRKKAAELVTEALIRGIANQESVGMRGASAVKLGVDAGTHSHAELAHMFSVVDPSLGAIRYERAGDLRAKLEARQVRTIAVRHGKTDANAKADTGKPVLCGQIEASLTEEGKNQAKEGAQKVLDQLGGDAWLRAVAEGSAELPIVYSSPLARAKDTGQAFVDRVHDRAKELGLDVGPIEIQRDARLLEFNYGDLELRPLEEFKERYPELYDSWESYSALGVDFLHRFPGGESRWDVLARTEQLLEEVAEKHAGKTVLMYCHLETIAMLRVLTGHGEELDGRLKVDAKSITNAAPHLLSGS